MSHQIGYTARTAYPYREPECNPAVSFNRIACTKKVHLLYVYCSISVVTILEHCEIKTNNFFCVSYIYLYQIENIVKN